MGNQLKTMMKRLKRTSMLILACSLIICMAGIKILDDRLSGIISVSEFIGYIVKMELSDNDIVKINDSTYLYKTGRIESLFSEMSINGYAFKDQVGSLVKFENKDDLIEGDLRPITRWYTFFVIVK